MTERFRIDAVQRVFDGAIRKYGFLRSKPTDFADSDHAFDEWHRENEWRRDSFTVVYRGGRTPNRVGVDVEIEILSDGADPIDFDDGNVPFLVGRSFSVMYEAGPDGSVDELMEMLAVDAAKVIGWFEQAATPQIALESIARRKEQENWMHLGRFNKVVAALKRVPASNSPVFSAPTAPYVEPPRPRGPLDRLLESGVMARVWRVPDEGQISIALRSADADAEHTLMSISMVRTLARTLGASPPPGLSEEETSSTAEEILWLSEGTTIPRDRDLVVSFPCMNPSAGSGAVRLSVESRVGPVRLRKTINLEVEPGG